MSDQNFRKNHEKCFLCRISRRIEWCHPNWPAGSESASKWIFSISRFDPDTFLLFSRLLSWICQIPIIELESSWNSNVICTQTRLHILSQHNPTGVFMTSEILLEASNSECNVDVASKMVIIIEYVSKFYFSMVISIFSKNLKIAYLGQSRLKVQAPSASERFRRFFWAHYKLFLQTIIFRVTFLKPSVTTILSSRRTDIKHNQLNDHQQS